jgi:5-methylcytosine-specific restriction endonuclease McrA
MIRYDTTPGRLRGRKAVERRRLWLSQHPICERCKKAGRTKLATEVDHIIPLCKGGEDDYEKNGQSLCDLCHKVKTREDMGYTERQQVGLDGWPVDGEGG